MSETIKVFVKLPVIIERPKYEDKELAAIIGEENEVNQTVDEQWFDILKLRSFYSLKPGDRDNNTGTNIVVMRGDWGSCMSVWVVMDEDTFTEMLNTHFITLHKELNNGDQVQETE